MGGESLDRWERTLALVQRLSPSIRQLPHIVDVAAFARHARGGDRFGIVVRVDSRDPAIQDSTRRRVQQMVGPALLVEVVAEGRLRVWWRDHSRRSDPGLDR
jgi:hypothetical protein